MKTVDVSSEIAQAQAGNVGPLAEILKDRPMSPGGFTKTDAGSFGDGEMGDRTWLQVESAVMDGELSEDAYAQLRSAVGR